MKNHKLPMRIGVGVILLNNKNQVFVGRRKDNPGDKWQMPQGGVEDNEDFITAVIKSSLSSTPPCGICHLSPGLSFLLPTKT